MQLHLVKVQRDPMTAISVIVGAHELPILEVVHGEGQISLVEMVPTTVDMPDPGDEYRRLAEKYGLHPELGIPIVEYVYGRGPDRLAAELEASKPTSRRRRSPDEANTVSA